MLEVFLKISRDFTALQKGLQVTSKHFMGFSEYSKKFENISRDFQESFKISWSIKNFK